MSSSLLARSEEVTLRRLSAKELKVRAAPWPSRLLPKAPYISHGVHRHAARQPASQRAEPKKSARSLISRRRHASCVCKAMHFHCRMVSRLLNPAAHQVKARAVKKRSRRIIVCSDDDDEEQETEEDTCPSCLRPIDAEEFIHPFNGNCHACQEKEGLA